MKQETIKAKEKMPCLTCGGIISAGDNVKDTINTLGYYECLHCKEEA